MKQPNQSRIAIYARVSTKDQDLDTQLIALRAYAFGKSLKGEGLFPSPSLITQPLDLSIAPQVKTWLEFTDFGVSGSVSKRPGLDALMQAAYRREFDVLVVARFDRFARSTRHLVTALEEFQKLGIDFVSLNESIDTSTPMGKMVFVVLGAVAELERTIIVERVKAGIARVRAQGKILGPPRKIFDREKVRERRAAGESLRSIAHDLGISKDTIAKAVKDMPKVSALDALRQRMEGRAAQ